MNYCSTRNATLSYSLSRAVISGIAPDGGLFYPQNIPCVLPKERKQFQKQSYPEIAAHLFQKFCGDSFSEKEIQEVARSAYSPQNFDHPQAAPIRPLDDNTFLLELFHGPTGAFKDFALQFLPQIMKIAIEKEKTNDLCILVATSGDTGGAALEGFADVLGTSCIVFFPRGGVSPLQQAQMQSATGGNILTLEVSGDFDQAQSAMKHLFQDADFTARVQELGVSLSSANSINIGRLLPQIFYSFAAHAQMVESGAISFDEKIDICVPTGNFGDIFSAFLAKKMGLPVQKLICASNANNTSAQVIKTGIFDVRERKTAHTASPAMDILRASNLERALFCASGNDSQKISRWQKELLEDGFFELDPQTLHTLRDDFAGETVSDNETLFEIQTTLEENKYLLDPHTAVARRAARQYQSRSSSSAKMLLFSTAHYGKFGQTVFSAVCPDQKMPSHESEILRLLQQKSIEPHLPQQFLRVLEKEKVHTQFIQNDVSLFKQAILSFLRSQRS